MAKKILTVKVIKQSDKNYFVASIDKLKKNKKYLKQYLKTKKYKVATRGAEFKAGEMVEIIETKPISKEINWEIYQKNDKIQNPNVKSNPKSKI
jgi:small subunit ribosomal protein S17